VNDQGEITTVIEDSKRQRPARPLLILGTDSNLGYAFARLSEHRGLSYHACTQHELDISNPASISTMIAQLHPWAVINAVSYREVDKAEKEVHQCYRDNVIGPAVLAAACAEQAIPLMTFSSDLVFDGQQTTPYLESNTVAPLNIYGQSKVEAEERVLAIQPNALIIRTSPFFGPWNKRDFVTVTLQALASGRGIQAAHDATISPTYIPDLVHTALDLLIDGESHIWHLANEGALTWADWACLVARSAGYPEWRIERRTTAEIGWSARRPSYSALRSERGQLLPPLDRALHCYFQDCDERWLETVNRPR
jgi:dTDP-4-dehydrorhamnose reductase